MQPHSQPYDHAAGHQPYAQHYAQQQQQQPFQQHNVYQASAAGYAQPPHAAQPAYSSHGAVGAAYPPQQGYSHTLAAGTSHSYPPSAMPGAPAVTPAAAVVAATSGSGGVSDPIPLLDFAPPSPAVQTSIDALVVYIAAHAGSEEYLRGQLGADGRPSYRFLFDTDPNYEYYRWRLYWLSLGRSEAEMQQRIDHWRATHPQHTNGVTQPPQAHPAAGVAATSAAAAVPYSPSSELHALSSLPVPAPLDVVTQSELDELLHTLDATKERIKAARQWVMRPGRSREQLHGVFAVLRRHAHALAAALPPHAAKLPLVYLLNDLVLAASKASEGAAQGTASSANVAIGESLWSALLPNLLPLLATAWVGHSVAEQESIGRIIDMWRDKRLLPRPELAAELRSELQRLAQMQVQAQQQQLQHQPPQYAPQPQQQQHQAQPPYTAAAPAFHPAPAPATPFLPAPVPVPAPAPVPLATDVLHLTPAFVATLSRSANAEETAATGRKATYTPLDPSRVPLVMPKLPQVDPAITQSNLAEFDKDVVALRARLARRAARSGSVSTSPSPTRGVVARLNKRGRSHSRSRSRSPRVRSRSRSRSRERSRSGRRSSRSRSRSPSDIRDRRGASRRSRSRSRDRERDRRRPSRSQSRSRSRSRSNSRSRDRDRKAKGNWDSRAPPPVLSSFSSRDRRSRSPDRRRR